MFLGRLLKLSTKTEVEGHFTTFPDVGLEFSITNENAKEGETKVIKTSVVKEILGENADALSEDLVIKFKTSDDTYILDVYKTGNHS